MPPSSGTLLLRCTPIPSTFQFKNGFVLRALTLPPEHVDEAAVAADGAHALRAQENYNRIEREMRGGKGRTCAVSYAMAEASTGTPWDTA